MKKLILTTLIALILSVIPTSAEHRHRTALPQLEEGFNWNEVPVICGSHEAIMDKMERLNMNLLHASFGKKGANPDGDVVFMVLYYANQQGTSTAAVLTMPNDPTACLLFVTFDVTLAPEKKQNF